MTFNKYCIYSVVSTSERKNEQNLELILSKINKIEELSNLNQAKEYLKDEFNTELNVVQIQLDTNCLLNIRQIENNIILDFNVQNNHIMYSYKK